MLVHWVMRVKTKVKDICTDNITKFGITNLQLRYKTFNVTYTRRRPPQNKDLQLHAPRKSTPIKSCKMSDQS